MNMTCYMTVTSFGVSSLELQSLPSAAILLPMCSSPDATRLQQHQVGTLPTLHYLPDYITADEEARILREVHAGQAKWVQLSGRRLQHHGGHVHTKGLIPAAMPGWLQQLALRVHNDLQLWPDPPNHVLINAYQPGCGIMPHQDGPLYHPVVCILSTGSPAVLRFWRKQAEGGTGNLPPEASILAMPRSLLWFRDEAYEDCLHGIEEVTEETLDASIVNPEAWQQQDQQQHDGSDSSAAAGPRVVPRQGERVSLTIRRVLKVHKGLAGILGSRR